MRVGVHRLRRLSRDSPIKFALGPLANSLIPSPRLMGPNFSVASVIVLSIWLRAALQGDVAAAGMRSVGVDTRAIQ